MKRERIFDLIGIERSRQDRLHPLGATGFNILAPSILGEEVGEVNHAYLEHDNKNLIDELVQTCAVCVRWLENLDE